MDSAQPPETMNDRIKTLLLDLQDYPAASEHCPEIQRALLKLKDSLYTCAAVFNLFGAPIAPTRQTLSSQDAKWEHSWRVVYCQHVGDLHFNLDQLFTRIVCGDRVIHNTCNVYRVHLGDDRVVSSNKTLLRNRTMVYLSSLPQLSGEIRENCMEAFDRQDVDEG